MVARDRPFLRRLTSPLPSFRAVSSGALFIVALLPFSLLPQHLGGALTWWLRLKREKQWPVLWLFFAVLALSFLIHGLWPAQIQWQYLNHSVDANSGPYGIIVGVALLGCAVPLDNPTAGAFSPLFLTPYSSSSALFVYTVLLFARAPRRLSTSTFAFSEYSF